MPFISICSTHMSNGCINQPMTRHGCSISGRIRIAHYSVTFLVIAVTALARNAVADWKDSGGTVRGRSIVDSLTTSKEVRNLVTTAYVTDIGECYKDLITADSNNDESMSSSEYVQFINLQSGNQFANITSFKDLPLELIQLFNFEACDCQTTSCCATNTSSTGSTNTATPSINITSLANTTSFCSDVTSTLASVSNGATSYPTVSPTTQAPTKLSTARPTTAPTNLSVPTLSPTNYTIPTLAPTASPTFNPTAAPTSSQELYTGPWNATIAFVGCNVHNYTISEIWSGQNNTMIQTIESQLGNRSSEVLTELRRNRRHLTVVSSTRQLLVSLNDASVIHTKTVECTVVNGTDIVYLQAPSCSSCLQLQAVITLYLKEEDGDGIAPLFLDKLSRVVRNEGLGYPGFVALAAATLAPTPSPDYTKPPEGLSTAAVIGIACAAFAAGILTIAGLYTSQRRQERQRKAFGLTPPNETVSPPLSLGDPHLEHDKAHLTVMTPPPTAAPPATAVAITEETNTENPEERANTTNTHHSGSDGDVGSLAESDVSSSQAGSSGWSSSAGLSSLNTGSFDSADLESGTLLTAASPTNLHKNLASLLLATAGSGKLLEDTHRSGGATQFVSPSESKLSVYKSEFGETTAEDDRHIKSGALASAPISPFTAENIDTAIISGGVTATLLSGRCIGGNSSEDSTATSDDVASESAKELDQLVDTGDWEGVVLAASKFERNSPSSFEENLRPPRVSTFIPSHSGPMSFDSTSRGTTGDDSVLPGDAQGSGSSDSYGLHSSGKNVDSASSDSVHNDEDSGSSSPEEASSTGISSVLSPATSSATGISETKRAEIRAEVEALVRRVVPDEINNVDEMMNQFKGREEELVETLRNMQERNIAKRERAARNKSAKLEAKREVRQKRKMMAAKAVRGKSAEGGLPPSGLPPRSAGAVGAAIAVTALREETPVARLRNRTPSPATISSSSDFSEPDFKQEPPELSSSTDKSLSGDTGSKEKEITDNTDVRKSDAIRESLEKAIESGNWEAVGEAATLMMDHNSTTSNSTNELRNLSRLSENDSAGHASASTGISSIDPTRKAELDSMIEAADWTGVALAAKKFSKESSAKVGLSIPPQEREEKPKSWRVRKMFGRKFSRSSKGYADTDSDGDDVFKSVTARGLQEEQDALAQAEIWMAIAAQSKQEGSKEAQGASAAADWAIERSLSALQSAERGTSDGGDTTGLLPGGTKDDTSV